jgi:hypothetical protein
MTQNYHTPHGAGAALNAAVFNQVYSDLDAGITANAVGTGTDGAVLVSDSAAASGRRWADFAPAGYVDGYYVSVSGGVVTVSAGIARDDSGVDAMRRSTAITIDPLGTGLNGLDTGSLAFNTWYRVYVIKNPSTAAVGGLMSSSDSPLMPSGYTLKRRVGWARSSSTGALYRQEMLAGRRVMWIEDTTVSPFALMAGFNVSNSGWDTINGAGVLPPRARLALVYFDRANAGGVLRIRTNAAQVLNFAPVAVTGGTAWLPVGAAQSFEITSSAAGIENVNMQVQGYIDDVTVV